MDTAREPAGISYPTLHRLRDDLGVQRRRPAVRVWELTLPPLSRADAACPKQEGDRCSSGTTIRILRRRQHRPEYQRLSPRKGFCFGALDLETHRRRI